MLKVLMLVFFLLYFNVVAHAEGDANRGKVLFNDSNFAGGTTGKSCATCHPGGKGLFNAASKNSWRMMGKNFKKLEDVINFHIDKALHGKPLAHDSQDMEDIIAYLKSLKTTQ